MQGTLEILAQVLKGTGRCFGRPWVGDLVSNLKTSGQVSMLDLPLGKPELDDAQAVAEVQLNEPVSSKETADSKMPSRALALVHELEAETWRPQQWVQDVASSQE
jgi:hypothetical protein